LKSTWGKKRVKYTYFTQRRGVVKDLGIEELANLPTTYSVEVLLGQKVAICGNFPIALESSYPETGSRNKSSIHLDMICDQCQDEILFEDCEFLYRNGKSTV
jgi:hypothetical protein